MSASDDARDARTAAQSHVLLGSVKAVFGTRGWLKVHSETRPRDGIFDYPRWRLGVGQDWQGYALQEGRVQGSALLAKLEGIDDRDAAERLLGQRIAVAASDLPAPPAGSYYWRDLIGLEVFNLAGATLGTVKGLFETGASDVLRIVGDVERLVPFVHGVYVMAVDLDAGRITVDWQLDD